ncbi:homoserine O-acetyltransferase [Luteococcus sp. H138]|uniref:homoserine O-acetyltransferase MetX n=1 Tax=unclassified Luteococcus TaxID=2639923 RepID=UPI00313B6FBB
MTSDADHPGDHPEPGQLGLVETQSVELFSPEQPLVLANGQTLGPITVAYETYGELNDERDNGIYICHALTGDAHAAGWHEGDKHPGWWDNLIGPGKPIDTNRWFVVCSNLLGGCQGTTGPSSINPATGEPWGLDFPLLDITDFVTVHRELARRLDVRRWHAVVGGSMGGMQALDWSLKYPTEMCNAVVIASTSRLTAQNIAFSAVGREAIMRDESFHGGDFAAQGENPDVGLSIARMMAHITYTSEEGFDEKFGRRPQFGDSTRGFGVDFAVESYLEHQGEAFLGRFDALSYLYLTRVMDYFDPFAARDALDLVKQHPVNYLVASFDTDWRFSTEHSRRIAQVLERGGLPVSFRDFRSPWGHDSFLLEVPPYHQTVRAFLECESASHPHTHSGRTVSA